MPACEKEEAEITPTKEEFSEGITAEKTSVSTFEIVSLVAAGNIRGQYTADFGGLPVQLMRTSDSTLTFYVPDVEVGTHFLEFDLARIRFSVQKTAAPSEAEFLAATNQRFERDLALLDPTTETEKAEVDSLKGYRKEVMQLFSGLTADERRQAISFYHANQAVFRTFAEGTFSILDAQTTMKRQSNCPRSDYKAFYGCTAGNLGNTAIALKDASKQFVEMLLLAGASAYLAPASFGLSTAGTALALGTAGYLLITEVRPAALRFKHSIFPFLAANWIFTQAVFEVVADEFVDNLSTELNLQPTFRSFTAQDGGLSAGSALLVRAMGNLRGYWNKLNRIFGSYPDFQQSETTVQLDSSDISITDISNPNVQLKKHTGESATFENKSRKEEKFSYTIRASKEGFTEEKVVQATIKPRTCEPDSLLGVWREEAYNTCYPNPDGTPAYAGTNTITVKSDGTVTYTYPDGTTLALSARVYGCIIQYSSPWGGGYFYLRLQSHSQYGALQHGDGCLSVRVFRQ
ncbi:hypothetical protein CGL56_17100 [Neolewinella marina]|uniref:Uncharacterized protein n=1 Tax=Neolewinella marina TaxID=438751 RepID=A0A2G0CBE9_9BACT|nr:hypothetical protein CGL56_17100 [Neolewinella marina]